MPGEGPLITVTEYASRSLEEGERLALSSSGGVLEVGWNGSLLPLGALQDLEKRVEVKVPPELLSQLEELSCWNISGEVSVSGAFAQELSLGSLAGDLFLTGVSGEKAAVSTVSGDIQWSQGQARELSVKSTSGAVRVVGMRAEECHLKTVTGPLEYRAFWGERHRFPAGPADRLPHRRRAGLCAGGYFPHPAGEQWLPGKAFQCFRPLYLGFFRFGAGRRLPL